MRATMRGKMVHKRNKVQQVWNGKEKTLKELCIYLYDFAHSSETFDMSTDTVRTLNSKLDQLTSNVMRVRNLTN